MAVELPPAPVDAADDGVQTDRLQAAIVLAAPTERRDDLLEREHDRDVTRLEAQSRGDARQSAAAALTREIGLRVLVG